MKSPLPPGSAKRILVVEDDKLMRDVLEIALANGGFQVVAADGGAEAVDLARLMHFDLVITDLIMPKMAGIETIMALLAQDPGVKIIAISGVQVGSERDFLPLARSLGASAILRKPFDRETLITTVRSVIQQESQHLAV